MGSTVEHYRTLMKEIIDLNKQTYLFIDWKIITMLMSVLLKLAYSFNVI